MTTATAQRIEMLDDETVVEERPQPAQAITLQQPQQIAAPAGRQLSVVEYAMQSGATAAEVKALVELQIQMDNHKREMRRLDDERDREERAEAARNAYAAALAAFKAEGVKVIRSKTITDGPLKGKKHADVFGVVNAATEALSKHGLSATWETLQDDKDWIKIACRIKHVAGHSESVAFGGPVDTGPGRNAIQARKSTVSYLNRITMELALGLAESDEDDDGAGGGTSGVGQQQTTASEALLDYARSVSNEGTEALRKWWDGLTEKERAPLLSEFRALRTAALKADQDAVNRKGVAK